MLLNVFPFLQTSELADSTLYVGTLHVRLAAVSWSAASLAMAQQLGAQAAAQAVQLPAKGAHQKDLFAGFSADPASDPYAIANKGTFVQYSWEAQEHRDMKKMVEKLKAAYDVETEQEKALKTLKNRVEGRGMELRYALKRQRELQMLEGLSDFVGRHYEKSEVLRNNVTNRYASVGISSMIWSSDDKHYTQNMFDALRGANVSEQDAESVKLVQAIINKQGELLEIWHGGFERAAAAGEPTTEQLNLTKEMAKRDKALGQGGEAHWNYFRAQKRKLSNMQTLAYAKMDAQHNGMLRRYNGALTVMRTLEDALRAILPADYRNSRVTLLLTLGHYFKQWAYLPSDWHESKDVISYVYNTVTRVGRKSRPVAHFRGEVVRLEDYARDEQAALVQEARNHGNAPLAAIVLKGGYKAAAGGGTKPSETNFSALRGAAAGTQGTSRDLVPGASRDLLLAPEECNKCVSVERLIDHLAEKREYIERLIEIDGAVQPRAEPPPVFAYHVHVSTLVCPRADGPGSVGAQLELSHRDFVGREGVVVVDLDAANLMRTFKNEVEVSDEGWFGWRIERVDEEKEKQKGYGVGRRHKDARLFESGTTDIFHIEFDLELGELLGARICAKEPYGPRGAGGGKKDAPKDDEPSAGGGELWMVEKVTVYKAPMTGAENDATAWSYDATGRSWLFQSLAKLPRENAVAAGISASSSSGFFGGGGDAGSRALTGRHKWGPVPVDGSLHRRWTELKVQAVVHVVVQLSEVSTEPDDDDLFVVLHNTSTKQFSGRCSLGKSRMLPPEPGSNTRQFVLHYDDNGEPLLPLINTADPKNTGVDELEVERVVSGMGGPYMLDAITLWWRSSETLRHFPCYEWLDRDEGALFTTEGFRLRKRLRGRGAKGDGSMHVGAPPPAPKAPKLEVRNTAALSMYASAVQVNDSVPPPPEQVRSRPDLPLISI